MLLFQVEKHLKKLSMLVEVEKQKNGEQDIVEIWLEAKFFNGGKTRPCEVCLVKIC